MSQQSFEELRARLPAGGSIGIPASLSVCQQLIRALLPAELTHARGQQAMGACESLRHGFVGLLVSSRFDELCCVMPCSDSKNRRSVRSCSPAPRVLRLKVCNACCTLLQFRPGRSCTYAVGAAWLTGLVRPRWIPERHACLRVRQKQTCGCVDCMNLTEEPAASFSEAFNDMRRMSY